MYYARLQRIVISDIILRTIFFSYQSRCLSMLFYSYLFSFVLIFQRSMTTNRTDSRCFCLHFLFQHIRFLSLEPQLAQENLTFPFLLYISARFKITFWSPNGKCSFSARFSGCLRIILSIAICEFANNESVTSDFIRLIYIHKCILLSIFVFLFLYAFHIFSGLFDWW